MNLWFTEHEQETMRMSYKIKETLHKERSKFQDISIVDTYRFGRMMILDDVVQTTEKDEFIYHELMVHMPLFTHPNPEKVLVIGGGDGGCIREVLKHPSVKKAVLVEIDDRVVEVSKQFLPTISQGLDDPRVEVKIEDGINYVKETKNEYDVIIVDSTDPEGFSLTLFSDEFYKAIYSCLKEDGLFVSQTSSPFFRPEFLKETYERIGEIFPKTKLYVGNILTYFGVFSFSMGSKKYSPDDIEEIRNIPMETKFFNKDIYKAAFALPQYVKDIFK
jgi:spermidine synthase